MNLPSSDAVQYNQDAWDRVAMAGDRWYRAVTPQEIKQARAGVLRIILTPTKPVPRQWLFPLQDKLLLCLAGAGGQQAPLLAAAGAKVTVFDLSGQQIKRDIEIAERENLVIDTVVGDMRDLSVFEGESFDLIVNPTSVCFCPDVCQVWQEAFRVLRPGGNLLAGFINPIYYIFDAAKMDRGELTVRHKIPYSDLDLDPDQRGQLLGPDRPLEYGHSLAALIGSQIEAGFEITGFYEDRWGDKDKLCTHINVFGATRATKPT